MKESEYVEGLAFIDEFENRVCEAFVAFGELTGIKDAHRYSFIWGDESKLTFEWEETWSKGGQEHHRQIMPARWLYDREDLTRELLAEQEVENQKKLARERERAAQQEAADKKRYGELHARFGET